MSVAVVMDLPGTRSAEPALEVHGRTVPYSWDGTANDAATRLHEPRTACGRAPCPEHGGLCAYHGVEPDRCPWCHSTWQVIISFDWHTCELSRSWRGLAPVERAARLEEAEQLRLNAVETSYEVQESAHCAHLSDGAVMPSRRSHELAGQDAA